MPYTQITDSQTRCDELFSSCHEHGGTIFITTDGEQDNLVLMTQKAYEQMADRFRLYALLEEGMEDVRNGRVIPAREAYEKLKADMENGTL